MLIISRVDKCQPYREDLQEIIDNILSALNNAGYNPDPRCKRTLLEKCVEKTAEILNDMEDPSNYKITIEDPIEAIVIRGILRILGIHARVKLTEKTTREQVNEIREVIQSIYDLASV